MECCLISDFDGVLVDSLPLIDEYVKQIDYRASDEYRSKLIKRSNECNEEKQRLEEEQKFYGKEMYKIKQELLELEKKRLEHYDRKNIVLEEVYPEYRNRIGYNEIYQIENAYEGVIELLTKIWEKRVYERLIVCTNVNTGVEIQSKRAFIKKYLPMAQFVPLRFFLDPYFDPFTGLKNLNRIPCDKLAVLTNRDKKIDIAKSIVVDDTKGVIESGNALGFNCYHRKLDDDVRDVFISACNDTIEKVHEGKIKKLSR